MEISLLTVNDPPSIGQGQDITATQGSLLSSSDDASASLDKCMRKAIRERDIASLRSCLTSMGKTALAKMEWNPGERSPLHDAAQVGSSTMVKHLLEAGMNVNTMKVWDQEHKCTPLHLATLWRHTETVKMLLFMGADPMKEGVFTNKYLKGNSMDWAVLSGMDSSHHISRMLRHFSRPGDN